MPPGLKIVWGVAPQAETELEKGGFNFRVCGRGKTTYQKVPYHYVTLRSLDKLTYERIVAAVRFLNDSKAALHIDPTIAAKINAIRDGWYIKILYPKEQLSMKNPKANH